MRPCPCHPSRVENLDLAYRFGHDEGQRPQTTMKNMTRAERTRADDDTIPHDFDKESRDGVDALTLWQGSFLDGNITRRSWLCRRIRRKRLLSAQRSSPIPYLKEQCYIWKLCMDSIASGVKKTVIIVRLVELLGEFFEGFFGRLSYKTCVSEQFGWRFGCNLSSLYRFSFALCLFRNVVM